MKKSVLPPNVYTPHMLGILSKMSKNRLSADLIRKMLSDQSHEYTQKYWKNTARENIAWFLRYAIFSQTLFCDTIIISNYIKGGWCMKVESSLLLQQKNMFFSTDRYKDNHYDGPMAVCLRNIPVAGVNHK